MTWLLTFLKKNYKRADFWIELAASFFTVAGVFCGTTTVKGAILYLIGCIFWFIIMLRNKLWGLWPLNIFSTLSVSYNLWFLLSIAR